MKKFMGEDFLLTTPTAEYLYNNFAKDLPIIDYHCHINPQEIAEDKQFSSITEAWLGGDHYKWRAIRACGFDEKYVTGDASDYDKFRAWAESMPSLIGNPLYHWTHLELKRYFGIDTPLSPKSCDEIWNKCNAMLTGGTMSVKQIIKKSNVKVICTTDDPADDLRWHKVIREDRPFATKVLPAFRPDKGVNIEKPGFADYIKTKLSASAGYEIKSVSDLLRAYTERLDFFEENGCKTSDHGMDYLVYAPCTEVEADRVFKKVMDGEEITTEEADAFKTFLLIFFAKEFTKRNWVMQMHFGVQRNNSDVNFAKIGPDGGFDTIGANDCIRNGLALLNAFERENSLPKMVFYSLNPTDNAAIDAMCGCFQGNSEGIKSKIQHGSAWWFNDHLEGMREQLKGYASIGVLANFIGMLTDSRSFLSYTRHEYFRRILCEYIGGIIERGEYPNDLETAGKIVSDISLYNTESFFGF